MAIQGMGRCGLPIGGRTPGASVPRPTVRGSAHGDPVRGVRCTKKTHTTSGRDGTSCNPGGRLGTEAPSAGIAGWFACLEDAMGLAAGRIRCVPASVGDRLDVDHCLDTMHTCSGTCLLRARLTISLPGIEHEVALALVDVGHQTCPCSRMIRGNVDVTMTVA
jgi:lipoyl-dependent peroxiredoxin